MLAAHLEEICTDRLLRTTLVLSGHRHDPFFTSNCLFADKVMPHSRKPPSMVVPVRCQSPGLTTRSSAGHISLEPIYKNLTILRDQLPENLVDILLVIGYTCG